MAGSGSSDAAFKAKLNKRTHYNEWLMLALILSLAAIALGFVVLHHVRRLGRRAEGNDRPSPVARLSRNVRRVALCNVKGLPSVGHVGVVAAYAAINVVIAFVNITHSPLPLITNVAARMAWVALGNLVVVIFLALKNTPLGYISPWSYEKLNILHQVAGYTTVTAVILHASLYSAYFMEGGNWRKLLRKEEIYGMVAGISLLLVGFSGAILRRWWYEIFFVSHIVFWILAIVMVPLHQPSLSRKVIVVSAVVVGLWVVDRVFRFARFLLYSVNNSVKLTPLSGGSTRVTLAKAPVGTVAGQHCFLWIPKVRPFETHPFTVASLDPLEFVVATHSGFTRALNEYAVSHRHISLMGSVEGPYGSSLDAAGYDTIVMVAGGSGASFAFGVVMTMLQKMRSDESKHIVFIWTVRESSYLEWFNQQLKTLRADNRVSTLLFVTREQAPQLLKEKAEPQSPSSSLTRGNENDLEAARSVSHSSAGWSETERSRPSDAGTSVTHVGTSATQVATERPSAVHGIPIAYERPDVAGLVRKAIQDTPRGKRVLALTCGPKKMSDNVRNTTASCIGADGPAVELHCEQFGW
ncbi:hypothetical protein HIM_09007 [Hirsutella minnesotensis 3608]|uniref:ferric-chelate reductase (NADPH) n=1 Tax=Hirsutella minnesotensis 3608 TaxID=1043627 RepID=A0A0F7ZSM3_9HYPO|nr:hypothetical protein HIM_09007 [Hirsutella minnesotensis 3608]